MRRGLRRGLRLHQDLWRCTFAVRASWSIVIAGMMHPVATTGSRTFYAYNHSFASRTHTFGAAQRREHRDDPLLRADQDAAGAATHRGIISKTFGPICHRNALDSPARQLCFTRNLSPELSSSD